MCVCVCVCVCVLRYFAGFSAASFLLVCLCLSLSLSVSLSVSLSLSVTVSVSVSGTVSGCPLYHTYIHTYTHTRFQALSLAVPSICFFTVSSMSLSRCLWLPRTLTHTHTQVYLKDSYSDNTRMLSWYLFPVISSFCFFYYIVFLFFLIIISCIMKLHGRT